MLTHSHAPPHTAMHARSNKQSGGFPAAWRSSAERFKSFPCSPWCSSPSAAWDCKAACRRQLRGFFYLAPDQTWAEMCDKGRELALLGPSFQTNISFISPLCRQREGSIQCVWYVDCFWIRSLYKWALREVWMGSGHERQRTGAGTSERAFHYSHRRSR